MDRFDLSVPSERWLWRKDTLKERTVLQSFAFDEVNRHLYVLQLVPGGADAGDLCLNRLDLKGRRLGHMYLRGFGHGVSMGVQNTPEGTVWIWTECAAAPSGYGRGVTRFRFFPGATRGPGDVNVRFPVPGSAGNQPSVCQESGRIAVRHRVDGLPRYRIYGLAAFVAGDYTPLADFPQTAAHPDPAVPFQGHVLHGDHLYQIAGTPYDARANPPAGRGDTHVSCLDARTGALVERSRTEAGHSLSFREPEGLAVRRTPKPWLCMGFASGAQGARRFSVYYKPRPS